MATNKRTERVEFEGADRISPAAQSAKKAVGELSDGLDKVKGALAALGVTVGAAAMLNLYRDTLQANAALDDMAESSGGTVENLSAIQRVIHVGRGDMEGFTAQLGIMVKGLKAQDEEGTKAAAALRFLNIEAKDSQGRFRDTAAIVIDVARAISKYEDGGNKLALVQDILGKGAQRYLPILKDIAEGTDLVTTLTAKQAAEAEQADKNMRRLELTFQDARRQLVVEFTPAIVTFTEKLLEARRASGGLAAALELMLRADTKDPGARLQEIDEELRSVQAAAQARSMLPGWAIAGAGKFPGIHESRLLAEREYLKKVQQQQALQLTGPEYQDARDLSLRQPGTQQLDYQTRDPKKDREIFLAQLKDEEAFKEKQAKDSAEMQDWEMKRRVDLYNRIRAMESDLALHNEKLVDDREARADEEYQRRKAAAADEIARLQDVALTAEQLEMKRYQRKRALLREAGLDQEEAFEAEEALAAEHEQKLVEIRDEGERKKWGIAKVYRELDMESTSAWLNTVSQLMQSHNRKAFEIGKAAAIAMTIVDTYKAAMGAIASFSSIPYVGVALGYAAAAAITAAGVARVQAIRNTQFGGGGGPTATFSADPSTGVPSGPIAPAIQAPRQSTIVQVFGTDTEVKMIRRFVNALNENTADGGRVILQEQGR